MKKCQKKVNHSANQSHTGFITGSIPVFTPVSPRKIFPVFKKDYSWKILIKFLDIWQLKYFLKNIKRIILSFHARISEIKNLNQNIIFDSWHWPSITFQSLFDYEKLRLGTWKWHASGNWIQENWTLVLKWPNYLLQQAFQPWNRQNSDGWTLINGFED